MGRGGVLGGCLARTLGKLVGLDVFVSSAEASGRAYNEMTLTLSTLINKYLNCVLTSFRFAFGVEVLKMDEILRTISINSL